MSDIVMLPLCQDNHLIEILCYTIRAVGNHQNNLSFIRHLAQFFHQLLRTGRIQSRIRFVEEEKGWSGNVFAGGTESFLFSAGKLGHNCIPLFCQAEKPECVHDLSFFFTLGIDFQFIIQRVFQSFVSAVAAPQQVRLRDVSDFVLHFPVLTVHILPFINDFPLSLFITHHRLDKGGFTCS